MELGGNAKAIEFFRKNNLKTDPSKPVDYSNSVVQRYKNDLTKKVDSMLNAEN